VAHEETIESMRVREHDAVPIVSPCTCCPSTSMLDAFGTTYHLTARRSPCRPEHDSVIFHQRANCAGGFHAIAPTGMGAIGSAHAMAIVATEHTHPSTKKSFADRCSPRGCRSMEN